MLSEAAMNLHQVENSFDVASIVGTCDNQHVSNNFSAPWMNLIPYTHIANDAANLAVGTAEPPMASSEEDKPRVRKHAKTPAENPAWSAKRVRENA
jgi:hypothetical protein